MRKGRTITAEVQAASFLQPADDLTYRIDYKHPNIRGSDDPNKTQGTISIFNSRKLSGVFAGCERPPPLSLPPRSPFFGPLCTSGSMNRAT